MADVFISYSRKDETFVDPLYDALAQKGLTIWIDRNSILASQAWWDEIKRGMDTSNNFVIIMSPNSMSSPICQMEIEYALANGKRIIPILYADFDSQTCIDEIAKRLNKPDEIITRQIWGIRQGYTLFHENHGALFHRNYVSFKEGDDFDKKFAMLYNIINTDFAHQENHTLLGLRAQTWDVNKRDVSFLLHGEELKRAETWLIEATQQNKDPKPTNLHTDYIHTSRDDENMRLSRLADMETERQRLEENIASEQVKLKSAETSRVILLKNIRRIMVLSAFVVGLLLILALSAFSLRQTAIDDADRAVAREANANQQLSAIPPTLTQVNNQIGLALERLTTAEQQLSVAGEQLATATQALATGTYVAQQFVTAEANLNVVNTQVVVARATVTQAAIVQNITVNFARVALENAGNPDVQLSRMNTMVGLYPEVAYAYAIRGSVHLNMLNFDEAIADYEEAIRLDPIFAEAYSGRGIVYFARGDYELALADYNEAIRLAPELAVGYANRSLLYYTLGNYEQALADADEALRLDSQLSDAYAVRAQIYALTGDIESALIDAEKAITLDSQSVFGYIARGLAYVQAGNYDEAVIALEEALRLSPRASLVLNNIGQAYVLLGRYQEAYDIFSDGIAISPNASLLYAGRGAAALYLGDADQALADFNEAIRLDPNSFLAYFNRGYLYYLLRDADQALADSNETIRLFSEMPSANLNPLYGQAYLNRGIIYSDLLGQYEDALADFNEAIRLAPQNGGAYLGRGLIYYSLALAQTDIAVQGEYYRLALADFDTSSGLGFVFNEDVKNIVRIVEERVLEIDNLPTLTITPTPT